jgi:hypothetical protein
MLKVNRLATALVSARERRGWTIYQTVQRMDGISHWTLRSLEGDVPDRNTRGIDCRMKTVLEIIRVYWPDVTLDDFVDDDILFKFSPKNVAAERKLKGFMSATG